MVKYKVVVTPRAQSSLRRITTYLKETVSNEVATKVRRGITESIKSLATLPHSHEVEHDISDEIIVFRRILKWDYRIIYSVDDDEIIVSVVEITHNAQDPERLKEILR